MYVPPKGGGGGAAPTHYLCGASATTTCLSTSQDIATKRNGLRCSSVSGSYRFCLQDQSLMQDDHAGQQCLI